MLQPWFLVDMWTVYQIIIFDIEKMGFSDVIGIENDAMSARKFAILMILKWRCPAVLIFQIWSVFYS